MTTARMLLCLLLMAAVSEWALSHHLRHRNGNAEELESLEASSPNTPKSRRSLQLGLYNDNNSDKIPYSYKKLDKMLKKAIMKVIIGEMRPADMMLLKALNYTLEEVMAIREHELSRIKEEELFAAKAKKQREQEALSAKYQAALHRRASAHYKKSAEESSLEAYNKQAVYDYENGPLEPQVPATFASRPDYEDSKDLEYEDKSAPAVVTEESFRQNFDRAMEPHVVFKIRYDDSEFDSESDERSRTILRNHRTKTVLKLDRAKSSAVADSFQASGLGGERAAANSAADLAAAQVEPASTRLRNLEDLNRQAMLNGLDADDSDAEEKKGALIGSRHLEEDVEQQRQRIEAATTEMPLSKPEEEATTTTENKRASEYEGLEWVGGDVYRVKPEAMEALLNYEDELAAAAADYESRQEEEQEEEAEGNSLQSPDDSPDDLVNDTVEYQNDAADAGDAFGNFTDGQNLTSYQRLTLAQRRDQGQKAIEDIKLRVLALTGRFNLTSTNNQVTRERLTMFSPTCQVPRNTDADAWSDPFSMNMHFQLNLTSSEHVLAAKLRLFRLPQESYPAPSSSPFEADDEDEKKIRVSVYFYTKSLKKHRVKKRLMDSVVMPLTANGSHFALDVRQSLRFWRPSGQTPHSSNHGMVVQVEDQDGKPLKPAMYIQQPSCQAAEADTDDKAYQFVPALFVRACPRYVRIVGDKIEMFVQCRPTQRH
ncbi:uncharacterized protein LOC100678174 isoform X3 [Nasonia vitripennis]|uniref:Uncharacterized protein n=1 Tax=Nasonia vitripennis TaxID=7425 RepID=A0A7M7LNQ4_NASVI|nr:uncharacterized protein LOC100678174 isoform X3 [Nasonia vitripennis]